MASGDLHRAVPYCKPLTKGWVSGYGNGIHHRQTEKFVWNQLVYIHFWLDLCCVVLFEGKSPLKECLSRQETTGQHYLMNWSKIGHSINELSVKFIAHIKYLHTCLAETMNFPETGKFIGWNIIIRLLSANKKNIFWNHGKFQIILIFY